MRSIRMDDASRVAKIEIEQERVYVITREEQMQWPQIKTGDASCLQKIPEFLG